MGKLDKIELDSLKEELFQTVGKLSQREEGIAEFALEQQYYKDKAEVVEALTKIFEYLKNNFRNKEGKLSKGKFFSEIITQIKNKKQNSLRQLTDPIAELLDYDPDTLEARP